MGRREEVWISVDIETGGPVPGLYPLLSIGACRVGGEEEPFLVELKPRPAEGYDPKAVQVSWPDVPAAETIARLEREGVEPVEAFTRFDRWVRSHGGRPVFVGYNAAFDWMFTHYGFVASGIPDPFGHSAMDIKSYWAGRAGTSWGDTGKYRLPPELTAGLGRHTHKADEDAVEQARILQRMQAWSPSG